MLDALNITEEEAAGLTELAQHDLALARDFARRAQAAEDADEANRLARSYQRAARSYRQTLALKARLRRDLAAADRAQAETPRPKPGGAAVARRIGEVRTALLRLAWTEAERPEVERNGTEDEKVDFADAAETFAWYRQDVEGIVAKDCLTDTFSTEPLARPARPAARGLRRRAGRSRPGRLRLAQLGVRAPFEPRQRRNENHETHEIHESDRAGLRRGRPAEPFRVFRVFRGSRDIAASRPGFAAADRLRVVKSSGSLNPF